MNKSFRFSLKISVGIIGIGIVLTIIGQYYRFGTFFDTFFGFVAIFGLIMVIFGFFSLITDLQLSNLSKIRYRMAIEPRGISVFQENYSFTDPISFFPFNAIISSEIVSVLKFIKQRSIPSISSIKFKEISSGLHGVLLQFKIDHHQMETGQQKLFFDVPLGYSLFIVEDCEKFLRMVKNKQTN